MLAADNDSGRLLRSGMIAEMLDVRGHEVVWWMSTYDHANRRSRCARDCTRAFGDRGVIRMLHSPGYRASISVARLRDHALWGRAFGRAIRSEPAPDVIFCAYPTIEAAAECVRYGRERGVPVVVDLRDMWPDIFIDVAPRPLRSIARGLLWPWRRQARAALGAATALTAITEEFLSWGLAMAGRSRNPWDGAYYLAYSQAPGSPRAADAQGTAVSFWDGLEVSAAGSFNVVLIGTMSKRRFEMDTVIAAARELQRDGARVKFVLAGDGDDLAEYREQARDCANVLFPGWLTAAQIHELLGRTHLGLVPYRNAPDYLMSVPNKVGEYLAAAVPVASCLGGTLERLLAVRSCGLQFAAGSPASLAALVRRLLSDEPLRLKLSSNARRTYQEELDAATVYGRLVDRLEELAASTAGLRSV